MQQKGCMNIFLSRLTLEQYQAKNIAIINATLIPCTLIANLAIICILRKTKALRSSRINNLFCCLAASNCIMALLVQPMVSVLFTVYSKRNDCLPEITTHFTMFLCMHFSGFTILAIGIDQYIQLKNIQWYKYAMTRKRAIGLVLFVGFMAFSMSISYVIATTYGVYQWINLLITLANIMAAGGILAGFLLRQRKTLKDTKHKIYKRFPGSQAEFKSAENSQTYTAPKTTVILMLASLLLCYLINVIMEINRMYVSKRGETLNSRQAYWFYLSHVLIFFNCFFDALVFLSNNKPCRDYFSAKLKTEKKLHKPKNDEIRLSDLVNLV